MGYVNNTKGQIFDAVDSLLPWLNIREQSPSGFIARLKDVLDKVENKKDRIFRQYCVGDHGKEEHAEASDADNKDEDDGVDVKSTEDDSGQLVTESAKH